MVQQPFSRCRPHYPTACCEVFHVTTAVFVAIALQILLCLLVGFTYFYLEKNGFFLHFQIFRVGTTFCCLVYLFGAFSALFGVVTRNVTFVKLHTTIMAILMIVTDVLAALIVLTMAIGNRNKFIESIPHYFVDSSKFYSVLGPFWMYLGAITLHVTVAVNICLRQVFTAFIKFIEETEVLKPKMMSENNNNNNNNEDDSSHNKS